MDFGDIFIRAGRFTWRHKFLWLFGWLMSIGHLASGLARLPLEGWLLADTAVWLTDPLAMPSPAYDFPTERLGAYLLVGVVALLGLVLLYWIIVTLAEGSIIGAVDGWERGQPVTAGEAFRLSLGWLKRFAALDALVFLPWFVFALVGMVVVVAVLLASLFVGLQEGEGVLETAVAIYLIGVGCAAVCGCLLVPIGIGSVWYRGLAFRDTAVLNHPVKQAIRHPWGVIKQNWSDVLLLTLFLGGFQYLAGWGVRLVDFFSLGLLLLGDGLLFTGISLLLILLATLLRGVLVTFTAVAWTIAYRELTQKPEG